MTRNADQIQGEIGEPDLAGPARREIAAEPIGGYRVGVPAIGGSGPPPQGRPAAQSGVPHQPFDP
jgi:hypothetical protein